MSEVLTLDHVSDNGLALIFNDLALCLTGGMETARDRVSAADWGCKKKGNRK